MASTMALDAATLRGQVVLITGGSSGIGEATALAFARHQAKLVITGRNQVRLEAVAQKCLEAGAMEVLPVIAELTKEEEVKSIATQALARFGTLHVLINNAGGGRISDNMDLRESAGRVFAMDYQYNMCVRAPWQLSGLLVSELIKNKGCIINVSSVMSRIHIPQYPAYGTMKAAMEYMTRCMATELGLQGVRVNAVLPGVTVTSPADDPETPPELSDEARAEFARRVHVLEQKVLVPDDVAAAILFLASGAAGRITGVTLPVDSGFLLSSAAYDISASSKAELNGSEGGGSEGKSNGN